RSRPPRARPRPARRARRRRRQVTTVASPERTPTAPAAGARTFSDRLLAAIPLANVYGWLFVVYFWESWGHITPWLFTDELEMTQLSRAIAGTGHPARRGI